MELQQAKKLLRQSLASTKKEYTETTLLELSEKIMNRLEDTESFSRSSCIAFYHAIAGEVQTAYFIDKWHSDKKILLPLVEGDDLQFFLYKGKEHLKAGAFGILEPLAEEGLPTEEPDLIIVPGVAFDRSLNRMGRGRGYYDRFLASHPDVPKIGICFDFQLVETVPVEPFDIKMDLVITDKEVITHKI
ncbi:5-formyltetrahydrofolate cyclo-ligase [Parabacteroides sp. PF5-5]|uniref:5-formyltetrahydrofolate cyclo-ligase n=1 Tax=unclassified Parabacteroides TaxID=2649774 RepID=UPI0024742E1E|nr:MULTISPECIES: 5-formyltetrahydrofolate cyclo-ligase [unclassified Parabacteroides]MDH6306393.1 5-formyltetrahydrofolate cyclo-ligase [Parabacteroides sp. PH5-39]MDH6314665.1 5-formyltetrahydrofolate cyclo-ligase [Parabacteroides sp. PF5-13]MDH6321104.1 5-formyltetrahydrofolate cyclo-ligase [Parabacteroides sp. PH5-13]MDH6324836.1 5-formyltetrahydrofolate cyclo-ligase [Parabacteroides sp. PH5-8]MDH6325483.1 5-formyltetrahydrofolate cyclo-ligase [Parabacteroides sp. PH5-41]